MIFCSDNPAIFHLLSVEIILIISIAGEIILLLQNAGEIILITKLLVLLTVYGNTTISWEARIELLSLVSDHILMLLLI